MVVLRIDGCVQDLPVTNLDDELIALRRDQVKALAIDSSVNVCATPCSTGSPD